MKAVAFVLYEVDQNDIKRLPQGFEVLQSNILYDISEIKHAGVDSFRFQKHFRHFLLKTPPASFGV